MGVKSSGGAIPSILGGGGGCMDIPSGGIM